MLKILKSSREVEFVKGSRVVAAYRNTPESQWNARLYVNNGETATLTSNKLKTEKGLEKWARKVLGN